MAPDRPWAAWLEWTIPVISYGAAGREANGVPAPTLVIQTSLALDTSPEGMASSARRDLVDYVLGLPKYENIEIIAVRLVPPASTTALQL